MLPASDSVSIFVPYTLRDTASGWLVGCWHGAPTDTVLHVLAVARTLEDKMCSAYRSEGLAFSVIGLFENDGDAVSSAQRRNAPTLTFPGFVRLKMERGQLIVAEIQWNRRMLVLRKQCKVFMYAPASFLLSELLLSASPTTNGAASVGQFDENFNCVEQLLTFLRGWQRCAWRTEANVTDLAKHRSVHASRPHRHADGPPCSPVERNSNLMKMACKVFFCSSFLCQFTQRFHQVRDVTKSGSPVRGCLRCQNTLVSILLDVMLGVFVLHHFFQWVTVEQLLDLFMTSANLVADDLQRLLHWLMGVPAGLKLNYPLNSALGYFFLYHIYLWKTYITVVRPILHIMVKAITLLGWLGFSFQLSLASDLMSLATFHVYCFYVYAARLYHLHVSGLVSLWRLVRGRKWNPLRRRVDSCAYSTDQLYLGTLVFMILLFLMPTTMLYYVVFCALRLATLAAIGLLHRIVLLINTAPIYAVLMYFSRSPHITGEVRLEGPVRPEPHQPLVFKLTAVPSNLEEICKVTRPMNFFPKDPTTWGMLSHNLIRGTLVYPF